MSESKTSTVKLWATLLLVFMVILYIISRSCSHLHEGWAWVRAFAEAGMIGALADWFAVVALFRHPLGIPIPHTAIVKEKKGRIGASLGRFVRRNFLSAQVLQAQVIKYKVVPQAFRWLTKPENSNKVAEMLRAQMVEVSGKADKQAFSDQLSHALCRKFSEEPMERGIGSWMEHAMHGTEFRSVLAPLLGKLALGVSEQREWVEENAAQRAPNSKSRLLGKVSQALNKAVSGTMVNQLSKQLQEASDDQTHPLYDKIEATIQEISAELQSEEENKQWATWRQQILASGQTQKTVAGLISQAGDLALQEQDEITKALRNIIRELAQGAIDSPDEIAKWEADVFIAIEKFADHYGDAFEKLIVDRVAEWDATALSQNLERSIGADLQFIRINGSLIGGLIGIALHGLGLLIWGH